MKTKNLTLEISEDLMKEWFRGVGAEIVVLCKDCYWQSQCKFEQELGPNGFCSKGIWRGDKKNEL